MKKRIELGRVVGEKEGWDIYEAILYDGEFRHKGYAIADDDGGTWTEGNPLEWENSLEGFYEYSNGGIDATTNEKGEL